MMASSLQIRPSLDHLRNVPRRTRAAIRLRTCTLWHSYTHSYHLIFFNPIKLKSSIRVRLPTLLMAGILEANVPPITNRDGLHEVKSIPTYTGLQRAAQHTVYLGYSGTAVRSAKKPNFWVDQPTSYWHKKADRVINHFEGIKKFKEKFFLETENDGITWIDNEGDVGVVAQQHFIRDAVQAFSGWLESKHGYKVAALWERTAENIRPDVTISAYKVQKRKPGEVVKGMPLMAIEFKIPGSIAFPWFGSQIQSIQAATEKLRADPGFHEKELIDTSNQTYDVLVKKGTAYAAGLNIGVVCIYNHQFLNINQFTKVDNTSELPFGVYGLRTTIKSAEYQAIALLGALVHAAEFKQLIPVE